MSEIITKDFKVNAVEQILESVTEPANTIYYVFVGNHIPWADGDTSPTTPNNSLESTTYNPYRNMIFGKQVTANDIKPMIKKNLWQANTVYTMYDHELDIYSNSYYVSVNEASQYHVFKCLYNNSNGVSNGTVSNVAPSWADANQNANLFSNSDTYYETSDGYQWKYMYSISESTYDKFATTNYIPLEENANVISAAVDGAIDVIKVNNGGLYFNHYISGQFANSQLKVSGNNLVYGLPATANTTDNFYSNCVISITSGTGKGQYKRITSSIGANQQIVISNAFSTTLDSTSQYEITPEVYVTGDSRQTVNCIARALINSSASNSVYRVEVLNRGAGYRYANTTIRTIAAQASNTTALDLKAIISPSGGHGADAKNELNASYCGFSVEFANTEGDTITTENDFRQVGIIKDPLFSNVKVGFVRGSNTLITGSDGNFLSDERFYQIKKTRLYGTATVNTTSENVVANEADTSWDENLEANTWIYVRANTLANSFLSQITATNSSTITLSSNVSFDSSNAEVYIANVIADGYVDDITTGVFYSQNTSGFLTTGELIVGINSYAVGNVANLSINSVDKSGGFSTFSQLTYITGTPVSGSFSEDERIYQTRDGSNVMTAYVHSSNGNNLYITNEIGEVSTNGSVITGVTSEATMNVASGVISYGDLEEGSGEIIYIQNGLAVSRANNTSETVKIIAEF